MTLAVYIATKNSPSGNPRRGWIIFSNSGAADGFVDEGYRGSGALADAGYGSVPATWHRITVTPGEYLAWRRKKGIKQAESNGRRRAKRTSRRNKRTSRRAR